MKRSPRPACGLLAAWLLLAAALPAAAAPGAEPPAPTPAPAASAGSIEELWERGERSFERGDLAASLEAFSEALSRDEQRARSWNYLGGVHFAQGDFAHALEEFRRAAQLDPQDVRAANNLGTALERLGRSAEAEQQYHLAAGLDPTYPPVWRNLGLVLAQRLGRPEAACKAWLRYLELAPSAADADDIRRELDALAAAERPPPSSPSVPTR